ncbi:sulfatase-like hydrolase/transferase [Candidatus Woesearchaeota archaeon]|nr:sulfatase-like hydrolase/transferase [Candidatus Woesearchaeota archaeon]
MPNVTMFDKTYVGNYVPVMTNISKEGVFFPQFYSNSIQTLRAQENILCGIYSNNAAFYVDRLSEFNKICLPQILKDAGYTTYFFSADDLNFQKTGIFMKKIGFDYVLFDKFLTGQEKNTEWGYPDDVVYDKLFDYLEQNYIEGQKLFVYVALDEHHYPFKNIAEYSSVYKFNPAQNKYEEYINSLVVQDNHLNVFKKRFMRYENNSYLMIFGDHSFPIGRHNIYSNEISFYEDSFVTSFLLVPPKSKNETFFKNRIITDKYSQLDIIPTILSLLSDNYFSNSFSFLIKKNHSMFSDQYESCQVLMQPYGGGFMVINQNNTIKKVYSFENKLELVFDLRQDPSESNPVLVKKSNINLFLKTNLCKRFKNLLLLNKLFGHRGLLSLYPENSLLAIEKAFERGFINVEIDITSLQDGTIILFHDYLLQDKTNSAGNVCDLNLSNLKKIKIKNLDGTISNQSIPLLEEVFIKMGRKLNYHLDLKDFGCQPLTFLKKLVHLIEINGLSDKIFLESTNLDYLLKVHELNSDIKLIYWNENIRFDLNKFKLKQLKNLGILGFDFNYLNLNPELIKILKNEGFKIHTYTSNNINTTLDLIFSGVDYVITDNVFN